MKFFFNIFVLCLLWFVCSCGVPRHIRKAYSGCYNSISSKNDTLLDLSGCFALNCPYIGTFSGITYCVVNFYEDGIVVRTTATTSIPDDFPERIQRKFHQISSKTFDLDDQKLYREGRGMYRWGIYELKGDTIKAQFINRPYPPEKYSSYLVMYKVIDRHTIQEISNKEVLPPKKFESEYRVKPFLNKFYNFIPIEKPSSSDCWLKEEKWFWCNEEDRNEYKRQIKK